jgi:hypothetical protein
MQFFDEVATSGNGSLPWLEDYLANNQALIGTFHTLESFVLTRAKNGYLAKFQHFMIYLPANKKLALMLTEALMQYSKLMHGYSLVVQLTEHSPYYRFALDETSPTNWFERSGSFFQEGESTIGLEENPFLKLPPYPVSNARKAKKTQPPTEHPTSDA